MSPANSKNSKTKSISATKKCGGSNDKMDCSNLGTVKANRGIPAKKPSDDASIESKNLLESSSSNYSTSSEKSKNLLESSSCDSSVSSSFDDTTSKAKTSTSIRRSESRSTSEKNVTNMEGIEAQVIGKFLSDGSNVSRAQVVEKLGHTSEKAGTLDASLNHDDSDADSEATEDQFGNKL